MASFFDGTEEVIARFLQLSPGQKLKQKSTSRDIQRLSGGKSSADALIDKLYCTMMANYSGRTPSPANWGERYKTDIADYNKSPEKLLERAVAMLAEKRHMPGWFNESPVASGVIDSYSDKRACVDLVHLSDEWVRLVELKWESDTPAYALVEILRYGLAYVFFRINAKKWNLDNRPFMRPHHVSLEVVAPDSYYAQHDQQQLITQISQSLHDFASTKTGGKLSMSLDALAFSEWFRIPFANGKEAKVECSSSNLTSAGQKVRDAFEALSRPVWKT